MLNTVERKSNVSVVREKITLDNTYKFEKTGIFSQSSYTSSKAYSKHNKTNYEHYDGDVQY